MGQWLFPHFPSDDRPCDEIYNLPIKSMKPVMFTISLSEDVVSFMMQANYQMAPSSHMIIILSTTKKVKLKNKCGNDNWPGRHQHFLVCTAHDCQ